MSLTPWLVQSGALLLSPVNTVPGQRRGSVSQIPLAVNPPVMSAVSLRCSPDAKPEASGVRRQHFRTNASSNIRPEGAR